MTARGVLRLAALTLGLGLLAGCSALSSLEASSKPLDTFELTALPAGTVSAPRGGRHLEVAVPTATGALTSDRIVIKPTPLQVQSLPGARWINDTTEHVQLLLVRSLANSGRFALVTGAGAGPSPDYVLMVDLQAFQAEITGDTVTVEVRMTLTLLDDRDGRVMASRGFSNSTAVAGTGTELVVSAFDAIMTRQLTDVVGWLARAPVS